MQLTDGAGATLLMTRREARRRGLPILGVFRSFAVVGVALDAVPTLEAEPNLQCNAMWGYGPEAQFLTP